jgi:hypothetical protein
MRDMEIQQGAQLTVRDTQAALFVHQGKAADLFGPASTRSRRRTSRSSRTWRTGTRCSSPRSRATSTSSRCACG